MLDVLGYASLDEFIDAVIPEKIRFRGTEHRRPRTEHDVLAECVGWSLPTRSSGRSSAWATTIR
jgi:glycine cleavage system pyridoxal-binding protein P